MSSNTADSAVSSFFKNKKKAGVGGNKIKGFKVNPPQITSRYIYIN